MSCWATVSRSCQARRERSLPFGQYWRRRPLVFSLVARCQGLALRGLHRGPRHLRPCRSQPRITLSDRCRLSFPGALVVARTDPSPGRKTPRCRSSSLDSQKSTSARRAVAKSGIACVIHHVAMRRVAAGMRVIAGLPGAKSHRVVTRKKEQAEDQADLLHRTGPILLCDEGGAFGNGSSCVRDPPACCANGTEEVVRGKAKAGQPSWSVPGSASAPGDRARPPDCPLGGPPVRSRLRKRPLTPSPGSAC